MMNDNRATYFASDVLRFLVSSILAPSLWKTTALPLANTPHLKPSDPPLTTGKLCTMEGMVVIVSIRIGGKEPSESEQAGPLKPRSHLELFKCIMEVIRPLFYSHNSMCFKTWTTCLQPFLNKAQIEKCI